jgi:hypothetical protein
MGSEPFVDVLQSSLAHLAVPYGGRQDARLEPKYIQERGLLEYLFMLVGVVVVYD